MLRITTESNGDRTTLRLEGRVIGPWTEELKNASDEALGTGGRLALDLAAVSFVGRDAVALIRSLEGRGVEVVSCSPFVATQLEEVGSWSRGVAR